MNAFIQDLTKEKERREITWYQATQEMGVAYNSLFRLKQLKKTPTVHNLTQMIKWLGQTDLAKWIVEK